MTAPAFPAPPAHPWLEAATILLVHQGSVAYGTSTPESDLDLRGVAIPPPRYFHGFRARFEQAELKVPDLVIYELRKFFRLAAECNPNILEFLWTDPADQLRITPLGDRLVAARAQFLSRKARFTYAGYARGQLKRIQTHRRWLLQPPATPPSRAEMGLPERTLIPKDQLAAASNRIQKKLDAWELNPDHLDRPGRIQLQELWAELLAEMELTRDAAWNAAGRSLGYGEDFLEHLERERRYRARQTEWTQYRQWKQGRNPARAALEAEHGYDTKHAMHLVRLLRMCGELLSEGVLRVRRPDAEELLAIRRGAWSYDELMAWAEREEATLDAAARASTLPAQPDYAALDRLCIELVEEAHAGAIVYRDAEDGVSAGG